MAAELDQVVGECKSILAQCIISANQAATAAASIGAAGLAPLESPLFTGNPRAPKPPFSDATASIATTGWIGDKLAQPSGIATLDSSGLVPLSQLAFTGLTFVGSWDADANSPALQSSVGTAGNFYVVSVSGSTNLNGITTWNVGDQALFGNGVWQRVPYVAPPISNLPLSSLEGIGGSTVVGNTMAGSASPQAISIASLIGYLPVVTALGSGLCPTLSGGTGAFLRGDGTFVTLPLPDLSAYALLNSPAFIGTATVATQVRNNNATAIASTAFVIGQQGQSTEVAQIKVNGTTSAGTSTYAAKLDHIHPTDTSRMAAANGSAFSPTVNGTLTVSGNYSQNGTMTVTGSGVVNGTLNVVGVITLNGSALGGTPQIPSGTQMLFVQASAPTGWTKQTTHNDKALRVVSGTGAGSGGSVAFSTVFGRTATDGHQLTVAEMPSHTITINYSNVAPSGTTKGLRQPSGTLSGDSIQTIDGTFTSNSVGGDGSHTHPMDIRVQYVDVLICSKD